MCNECINNEVLNNNEKEINEYINVQTGAVLDLVRVSTLPDNAMLRAKPEMWEVWNFEKNDDLNLNVWEVTRASNKMAWWLCPKCKSEIKNNKLSNVVKHGVSCNGCSDGVSYPERMVINLLKELNVKYIHNKMQKWSDRKLYDFYIPSLSMIIETHGKQHYEESQEAWERNLIEEQVNDQYKYEMAMENGIKEYIVIDCRKSDFGYIKNNILNSRLAELFDLSEIDWIKVSKTSSRSIIFELCEYYDNNDIGCPELAKLFDLGVSTIRKYLKKGAEMGICSYTPYGSKATEIANQHKKRRIIQLSHSGGYLFEFDSINSIGDTLGKKRGSLSSISAVCRGKGKSAFGYRWMYKEDYEQYSEETH